MSANGMARPRPAPTLLDYGWGALRKAQGARDAHISAVTGYGQHNWDRRRQEHLPFGRVRPSRCDCSAAEAHPSSAWMPAQQYPALPDRDGNLFRHAFYRTTADGAWSRCASDPGAVRQAVPQGTQKRLPRRRGNRRSGATTDHALRVDQDTGADGFAGTAPCAL